MKRLIMNDKRGKKDMAGTECEVMFHAFDALAVFVGNTQVFVNRNDVELVERKRKKEKRRRVKEKRQNFWKLEKKHLSLQCQNNSFDYAAECGEQALIETTPFKSHLLALASVLAGRARVAFIFHIFCGITYDIVD